MKIFIETERLILREIVASDAKGMFELDNNPKVLTAKRCQNNSVSLFYGDGAMLLWEIQVTFSTDWVKAMLFWQILRSIAPKLSVVITQI